MGLWTNCERILHRNYFLDRNSYHAAGETIEKLKANLKNINIRTNQHSEVTFLINDKKAFFTRVPVAQGKNKIASKYDDFNITTTCKAAAAAVKIFLKAYPRFTIGLAIGTEQHDMALFIKKNADRYQMIHFEPNPGRSSRITARFARQFGKSTILHGYHDPDGNTKGKCTYLAYLELLNFMIKEYNPMLHVPLLPYCTAAKTYISEKVIKRSNSNSNSNHTQKKTNVQNQQRQNIERIIIHKSSVF